MLNNYYLIGLGGAVDFCVFLIIAHDVQHIFYHVLLDSAGKQQKEKKKKLHDLR